MKIFRIDRETLESSSKVEEKKRRMRNDEKCLLNTYSTQNGIRTEKTMKFKR